MMSTSINGYLGTDNVCDQPTTTYTKKAYLRLLGVDLAHVLNDEIRRTGTIKNELKGNPHDRVLTPRKEEQYVIARKV